MKGYRILKKSGKFYIQESACIIFWRNLRETNNPAYRNGCPPFESAEEAKAWLRDYVSYRVHVVYPVIKVISH